MFLWMRASCPLVSKLIELEQQQSVLVVLDQDDTAVVRSGDAAAPELPKSSSVCASLLLPLHGAFGPLGVEPLPACSVLQLA